MAFEEGEKKIVQYFSSINFNGFLAALEHRSIARLFVVSLCSREKKATSVSGFCSIPQIIMSRAEILNCLQQRFSHTENAPTDRTEHIPFTCCPVIHLCHTHTRAVPAPNPSASHRIYHFEVQFCNLFGKSGESQTIVISREKKLQSQGVTAIKVSSSS